jgi:hypothetical protein
MSKPVMPAAAGVAVVVAVAAALLSSAPMAGGADDPVAPFRGLGAWIDIYDDEVYGDPEGTVADLAEQGVRTIYLQTTTHRRRGPIRNPDPAGRYLEAAHAEGMQVVAWYVPGFTHMEKDLSWSLAAIRFVSPAGERFDGFGLDIEVTDVADDRLRAERVVELSRRIRDSAGPSYPLAAIVPNPLRSSSYWPVFPDRALAEIYDAYLPMTYWSYHVSGESGAHDYVARAIAEVRRDTGRPELPVHVIGGIANGAPASEIHGFVRAASAAGVVGASLYDVDTSGPEDWAGLRDLRFAEPPDDAAPADRPEIPRPGIDLGVYGTVPQAEGGKDGVATFRAGPLEGGWEIDYEGFDVGGGEVALEVNGQTVTMLRPTPGDTWGSEATIPLPRRHLEQTGQNEISFRGDRSSVWAVRRVTLVAGPMPLEPTGPRGAVSGSDPGRTDRATFAFEGHDGPMSVTVRGFDLVDDEVRVLLNGVTVEVLPSTRPDRWGRARTLILPSALLEVTGNLLTFDSVLTPDEPTPWGIRVQGVGPSALA